MDVGGKGFDAVHGGEEDGGLKETKPQMGKNPEERGIGSTYTNCK